MRFATVTALRDAAVAVGYPCPNWEQTNFIPLASESGSCSVADELSVYGSDSSHEQQVRMYAALQQLHAQGGGTGDPFLVGPNWIVSGDGFELSLLAGGLGGDLSEGPEPSAVPTPEEVTPTPSPSPTPFDASPADWRIDLKILRKQCFGSAGCNVTVRIQPEYVGPAELPEEGVIEVTYQIHGGEDVHINTFEVEAGVAYHEDEERISTASSGDVLTAKATEVEFRP